MVYDIPSYNDSPVLGDCPGMFPPGLDRVQALNAIALVKGRPPA